MGKKYIIEIPEDKIADFVGSTHFLMPYMMAGHIGHHDTGLPIAPYTEPDMEQVRKEAYQKGYETGYEDGYNEPGKNQQEAYQRGLNDAWEAAKKIWEYDLTTLREIFGEGIMRMDLFMKFTASEVIEEIRAHEQAQKEKEEQEEKDFVTTEEVMRRYLDTFCKRNFCTKCILYTPDFTCGRGYSFLTNSPVSDEEVRRAYAAVIAKLKE